MNNSLNETRGYSYVKKTGKYNARLTIRGQLICLGSYDTPEEAHQAFIYAKKYYTELAKKMEGRL
jgi:hypothetical protein